MTKKQAKKKEEDLDELFDEAEDLDELFDSASDWPGAYEGFDPQAQFNVPDEKLAPGQMTKAEAMGRHGLHSATLGAVDPLVGAGAAAVNVMDPSIGEEELNKMYPPKEGEPPFTIQDESPKEAYYAATEKEKALREKAMEDQPAASVAGMVGGSLMTPIPGTALGKTGKIGQGISKLMPNLKGYQKITKTKDLADRAKALNQFSKYKKIMKMKRDLSASKAATEGLKVGAIFGLTQGDARLLEGDLQGALDEMASGAVLGAATGAAFTRVTDEVYDWVKSSPWINRNWKAFVDGVKGKIRDPKVAKETILAKAGTVINELKTLKESFGKNFDIIDEIATKNNIKINTEDDLKKIWDVVNNLKDPTAKENAKKVLKSLLPYVKDNGVKSKAFKQVEKKKLLKKLSISEDIDIATEKNLQKELKKALKNPKEYIRTDQHIASADDVIPGAKSTTKAAVRTDYTQKINPETGQVINEKNITPQVYTEFAPSKIQEGIDPESGLEFAVSKDLGSGKIMKGISETPVEKIDATDLTLQHAREIRGTLKNFTKLKDNDALDDSVQKEAQKAIASIRDKEIAATSGMKFNDMDYKEIDKKYEAFKNALGILDEGAFHTKFNQDNMKEKFFNNLTHNDDIKASTYVKRLVKYIRETDPELAAEFGTKFDELRELYLRNKGTGGGGLDWKVAVLGGATELIQKISRFGGQFVRLPYSAVKGTAKTFVPQGAKNLTNKSLEIVKANPIKIQKWIRVLEKQGEAGKAFISPLQKALDSPERTKNAIMYGLYQRPAFRDIINNLEEDEKQE